MKTEIRYKYNVITKEGEESWTGVFESKKQADEWYAKHGKFHEGNGHTLILRIVKYK